MKISLRTSEVELLFLQKRKAMQTGKGEERKGNCWESQVLHICNGFEVQKDSWSPRKFNHIINL